MTELAPSPSDHADPAFIEVGTDNGHAAVLGGLTVLERVIRAQAKLGVTRVVVAAEPIVVDAGGVPHGVAVEWTPGGKPAAGQAVVRGDEIHGIRVVDADTRKRAEWAVFQSLPKGHQGPTDAYINCHFSLRISRQLAKTSITPNAITIAATVWGLIACAIALGATYTHVAIAGVMLQFHNIFDSCDGEIARLKYKFTKIGAWLDNILDEVVDNSFIAVMGIVAGGIWMPIGVAAAAMRLASNALQWVEQYRLTGSGSASAFRFWFESHEAKPEEIWDRASLSYWLRALGRRDTYCLMFMIFCLAGQPGLVGAYAFLPALVTFVLMMLHLLLRGRQAPPASIN
ncbi:MAG: CDP-alcohol phosphatidyltransferase family protein [Kofleriaceae bacterium]